MQYRLQDAGGTPDFEAIARLCGVASNPQRLRLLYDIGHGINTVAELAERIGMTTAGVSAHLGDLRDRGLVRSLRIHPRHEWQLAWGTPQLQRLALAFPEIFAPRP
jgi:DNA-binding transcriptional ArsR family regulator